MDLLTELNIACMWHETRIIRRQVRIEINTSSQLL